MRSQNIIIFLTVLVAVFLAGHADAASGQPAVTVVYMADAEPINWEEGGVAKGLEVDIFNYIFAQLGIKVIHEFYPWKRAQLKIENGEADVMMTTPTARRFRYAVFGKENALPNFWNLFYRQDDHSIENKLSGLTRLEDLQQFDLIDFIGNGWTEAFMKNGYRIHTVPRLDQLPYMLAKGRGDLLINSSTWMRWWSEKQGLQDQIKEHTIEWPWTRFHFVFMVSRKSSWAEKGLVRAMDEELKKMKESAVWYNLLKKYKNPHGSGMPFNSHLDRAYEEKYGFYKEYDSYPLYQTGTR